MKATICIAIVSFYYVSIVQAQGLDGSPAGVMISHNHPKGGWMFSYTYSDMMMKDNLSGTSKVGDNVVFSKTYNGQEDYAMSPQTMKMDMHMFMAMYGVTGRFSLMLMANYMNMSMDMRAFAPTMTMGDGEQMTLNSPFMSLKSAGLGDTKLYGLYKLMNGNGSQLVLSGGVNLPSGRINLNGGDQYLNMRLPYMMQLGTGSYDLMPGLTYLKTNGGFSWSVQVLSTLRPFNNANGYHYGNEATANLWASYRIAPVVSTSLRLEGYAAGIIEGQDAMIYIMNESDADPRNYGGQRASGYIGLNYYINSGALKYSKLGIEYGIPFYQNLNGPQLSTQSTLNAALAISF